MKLNNKGWGISQMIALLGILFFFFLLSIVLIIRFAKEAYPSGLDVSNGYNDVAEYTSIEGEIEKAANKYINSKYSSISQMNDIIIPVDTLQQLGFYSNVGHEDCDGYVISNIVNGSPVSEAYVKCSDYTTKGYHYEFDE